MDYLKAKELLEEHGQSQLLEYYGELTEEEREELLGDIERIDFKMFENIGGYRRGTGSLSPIEAVGLNETEERKEEFLNEGLKVLKQGKAAAVLLAGGQGTRLGTDYPKGMYDLGVTRELTIFGCQFGNLCDTLRLCETPFHVFVMTSRGNFSVTQSFLREKKFFGYPPEKVHFYIQGEAPSCDLNGKIFLENKSRIALNPNGNGGWFSSLIKSGLGAVIESEGIEWLNVYSVDNVLQRICDPVFIGATLLSGCQCGAKVVKKAYAEEKVGVICKSDGKPTIVEYYEMPNDLMHLTDKNGELVYKYGVILNYLFPVERLMSTVHGKLPYHYAQKAITHMEKGNTVVPDGINGYKFETLVVDMIEMMGSCLACEVDREREFAPVKNRTGADSVDTARILLEKNGVRL